MMQAFVRLFYTPGQEINETSAKPIETRVGMSRLCVLAKYYYNDKT